MASALFSIGDVVWAKMKGFPAWPGKIVNPTKDVKRPAGKKPMWCVYFFGTDNYAWILEENIKNYLQHKDQHFKKGGRGGPFKEACEAAEEFLKLTPKADSKAGGLPSIDEELNMILEKARKGASQKSPSKHLTEESEQKVLSKPMVPSPVKKRPDVHQLGDIKEGLKRSSVRQMSGSSDETPVVKKVKRDDDSVVTKTVQKSPAKLHASHMNDRDNQMTQIKHRVEQSSPDRITPPPTDMPIYSRNETFASTKPLRFGFLGQGIMGSSMVQNLIKSGHKVVVWNRTSSKCQPAVDAGAHEKDTPADVVAACDITFACVADSAAIREVVSGPNGAASGMTDGKGFVNMSVVDVETSLDISDAITAAGGRFLEAVVTGSRIQAEQKQLIFIAAGDRTLFADCEFCFRAMGKRSIYLGDVGNATRMKIVINMMMGTVIAGMAEGMALAEKCGVNQHDVLEILEMGSMNCGLIRLKGKSIVEGADQENAFQPHFPLKHQQKDLRLALAMGDQVDQPLPITAATNELFKRARSLGYGDQDMAAVYKATFL